MAPTFGYSPTDRFTRRPDLRMRPLPELESCLVYRRRPPKLFRLNPTAWFLLDQSDGRPLRAIEDAFGEATGTTSAKARARVVQDGLRALARAGLVRHAAAEGGQEEVARRSCPGTSGDERILEEQEEDKP